MHPRVSVFPQSISDEKGVIVLMTDKQMLLRSTPEEQGVSSKAILAFLDALDRDNLELHGFMLLRHGFVISEGWWSPYDAKRPHMLFSLTKSFTSTAIGLGVAEGLLTVDDTVVSFFPEVVTDCMDERLASMRVKDLLTMSVGHAKPIMGSEWRQIKEEWVRYFLNKPMDHEPGTRFVYNSGATYMLSAILQRITGQTLLDYLQPRLFKPIGIEVNEWNSCPSGINAGGWGLSLKTEDIARFGQLYLQNGVWNGVRVLPEEWIREATSSQISSGHDETSDAQQGYGYQLWRCRHGAYRADGAFGQICIVMPDQDAVVAIHAGLHGSHKVLEAVWSYLLSGMQDSPLAAAEVGNDNDLSDRLKELKVMPEPTETISPLERISSDCRFIMEPNPDQVQEVSIIFDKNSTVFRMKDHRGEHQIRCGIGIWLEGETTMTGNELHHQYQPPVMQVVARGVWENENTIVMTWCFIETPFIDTVTCSFQGDQIILDRKVNVNSAATERPTLFGTKK
jgi:CubicO group peptidase (beta-lactamase class C family)